MTESDDSTTLEDFRVGMRDARVILQMAVLENVPNPRVTMTADEARRLAADLTARAEHVERERR